MFVLFKKAQNLKKKYQVNIVTTDFTNYENVVTELSKIKPDVIVNFAGLSNVFNPWDNIDNIYDLNCKLPLNILKYVCEKDKNIFFVQSSSSLMYGNSEIDEIDENSPLRPIYPYGITKAYVHNFIQEFRKNYNIQCSSLIFFNHESEFRNENFLSKKVAKFIAHILTGESNVLELGDLNAYKDISHAYDIMMALKMIIDNKLNEDFILSSGKRIQTYEFVKKFFSLFDLDMEKYVKYKPNNRNETIQIFGNNSKIKKFIDSKKFRMTVNNEIRL
jgi:GDPmannose 4,6-dehydratase